MTLKHYAKNPLTADSARVRGAALALYLSVKVGGKWKVRVWENLGWCYQVSIGSICIYYHAPSKTFNTLISDHKGKPGGGAGIWSSENGHSQPEVSLNIAMAQMEKQVLTYVDVMNANRRALGMPVHKVSGIYSAITGKGVAGSSRKPGHKISSNQSSKRSKR